MNVSIGGFYKYSEPGLFTGRDCCGGKEASHEAVVNYRKWAATKPML
jgi:hypothetical protein